MLRPKFPQYRYTWSYLLWSLICMAGENCLALRLTSIRVPSAVLEGQKITLECKYVLEGDKLYAVKWYRDVDEFYRYIAAEMEPLAIFPLPGVEVEQSESDDRRVTLKSVSLETSGNYRCEISTDFPSFRTVSGHGNITVIKPPEEGPVITGVRRNYNYGEVLTSNCTAFRSLPPVQMTWLLNNQTVEELWVQTYPPLMDSKGLYTSNLGIQFQVQPRHFVHGSLTLRCTVSLGYLYNRFTEQSATLTTITMPTKSQPLPRSSNNGKLTSAPNHSSHTAIPAIPLLGFCLIVMAIVTRTSNSLQCYDSSASLPTL